VSHTRQYAIGWLELGDEAKAAVYLERTLKNMMAPFGNWFELPPVTPPFLAHTAVAPFIRPPPMGATSRLPHPML
jgi:hypothetical protein